MGPGLTSLALSSSGMSIPALSRRGTKGQNTRTRILRPPLDDPPPDDPHSEYRSGPGGGGKLKPIRTTYSLGRLRALSGTRDLLNRSLAPGLQVRPLVPLARPQREAPINPRTNAAISPAAVSAAK